VVDQKSRRAPARTPFSCRLFWWRTTSRAQLQVSGLYRAMKEHFIKYLSEKPLLWLALTVL